jgi:hypothetical protein
VGHSLQFERKPHSTKGLLKNGTVPNDFSVGHETGHLQTAVGPVARFEGLVRSREAAKLLCMSEWQLRQLAHEGELPYIQRTPRSPLLFDVADLRRWVERGKVRK